MLVDKKAWDRRLGPEGTQWRADVRRAAKRKLETWTAVGGDRTEQDIEDALDDAFADVWRDWPRYESSITEDDRRDLNYAADFWFKRAQRPLWNSVRDRKRLARSGGAILVAETIDHWAREQRERLIEDLVCLLSPAERDVVWQMFWHGRSRAETARLLGVPITEVKVRRQRALRQLRRWLGNIPGISSENLESFEESCVSTGRWERIVGAPYRTPGERRFSKEPQRLKKAQIQRAWDWLENIGSADVPQPQAEERAA